MQNNAFFKSLFFEFIKELEQPTVVYRGEGRNFEEDPETIIVTHYLVQFNHYTSAEQYSKKLDELVTGILSELEKALLENAIWMLQFSPSELIETIKNLKKYLIFDSESDNTNHQNLPFSDIKFVHSGPEYQFNTITQGSESLMIQSTLAGRNSLKSSLNLYANLFERQIDKLAIKTEWLFEKILQRNPADSNLDIRLTISKKEKKKYLGLISKNKLSKVFLLLEEACESNQFMLNQVTLLKNRHYRLNQQNQSGTVNYSDVNIESNRIVQSLLELVEK